MERKNKKPIIFLILKIVGFVLLAVGITLIIVSTTIEVPEMGEDNWFDMETKQSGLMFGGIACCVFAISIIIAGFMTEIAKVNMKTMKYIQGENKEVLTDIADTSADISKGAVTKMTKAVKQGFAEDQMFCKHCGASIDIDSKFCNKCGKEQ